MQNMHLSSMERTAMEAVRLLESDPVVRAARLMESDPYRQAQRLNDEKIRLCESLDPETKRMRDALRLHEALRASIGINRNAIAFQLLGGTTRTCARARRSP